MVPSFLLNQWVTTQLHLFRATSGFLGLIEISLRFYAWDRSQAAISSRVGDTVFALAAPAVIPQGNANEGESCLLSVKATRQSNSLPTNRRRAAKWVKISHDCKVLWGWKSISTLQFSTFVWILIHWRIKINTVRYVHADFVQNVYFRHLLLTAPELSHSTKFYPVHALLVRINFTYCCWRERDSVQDTANTDHTCTALAGNWSEPFCSQVGPLHPLLHPGAHVFHLRVFLFIASLCSPHSFSWAINQGAQSGVSDEDSCWVKRPICIQMI